MSCRKEKKNVLISYKPQLKPLKQSSIFQIIFKSCVEKNCLHIKENLRTKTNGKKKEGNVNKIISKLIHKINVKCQ